MSVAAYLRVSTGSQTTDQQRDAILAAGIEPDRWFDETASGAAGSARPIWTECTGWLRDGDQLVVVGIDRLGRSVAEVATAIDRLTEAGVTVRSLREGIDTSTSTGRMIAAVLASVAELELSLGRERRAASRAARVARGFRRPGPVHSMPTTSVASCACGTRASRSASWSPCSVSAGAR